MISYLLQKVNENRRTKWRETDGKKVKIIGKESEDNWKGMLKIGTWGNSYFIRKD